MKQKGVLFLILLVSVLCLSAEFSVSAAENKQYAALREQVMEEAIGIEYAASEEPAVRADIQAYRARLREEAMEETLQKAPSMVRFSAAASTEHRTSFYIDYILPLYYSEDQTTLIFFNPKQVWHSPRAEETNLGVGLRKLFAEKYILGLHFFRDKKLSHGNFWHRQLGVGAEYLSDPLDLRFNYYHPTTKSKMIDYWYGFTETSLGRWETREEPLEGYDVEAGTPVFGDKLNTRIFAGGFFYNSRLGKDKNGFRARTETNLAKWLSIDTIYNQKSGGESEFIGGVRVNLPLELTKKNPFKVPARKTPLRERMFDRVVRDIDIQTNNTTVEQTVPDAAGNPINMIYVDNSNTSGIEDGSRLHPYNTLAEAFSSSRYGPGAYVYIFQGDGTNTGYTSGLGYTLADRVILWGSGYGNGYKGLPVTEGYPKIDGDNSAVNPVITLANNNTIMGLDIQHGYYGIYGLNKDGADINHNYIANNSLYGIYLNYTDNADYSGVTIADNTVTGNGAGGWLYAGIYVGNRGTGTFSDFTFTGNTVTENRGHGIYVYDEAAGTMSDFTFTGNTVTGNDKNGIYVYTDTVGIFSDFTFTSNTVTGNDGYGIYVCNDDAGTMSDFTFTDNTVTGNNNTGIYVCARGSRVSDFTISGNTVSNNGDYGMYIVSGNSGNLSDFLISNNTINENDNDGIQLCIYSSSSASDFTISNNTMIGNSPGYSVITIYNSSSSVSGFLISDNIVRDSTNDGIGFFIYGSDSNISDFTVRGNLITGNMYDGIYVYNWSTNGNISDITFTNNTIAGNRNGIYVYNNRTGAISDFTFTENAVTGNTQNGFYLRKTSGSMTGINLGDGTAGGSNSIYDNGDGVTYFDIRNDSGVNDLPAQNNWWGAAAPDAAQFGGANTVDRSNPLSSPPE